MYDKIHYKLKKTDLYFINTNIVLQMLDMGNQKHILL